MINDITVYNLDKVIELYNITYTYNSLRDRIETETLYKKKRCSLFELRGLDRYTENVEYYQELTDAVIRWDPKVNKNMIAKYRGVVHEIVYIADIGRDKFMKLRLKKIDN